MFCQPKTCTKQHLSRAMQNFHLLFQVVTICHPQCAAAAFKWKAINEECVIWCIRAAHQHINILLFSNLCFITIKKICLSKSNFRICSSFLYANLATLAQAAVSESNTFPIVANRNFKKGWFSL